MLYKERGVYGPGNFYWLVNFLCWYIPLKPRNFVFSKPACCRGNNEVVEHVLSYLLSVYIQALSTFYPKSS